MVLSTNSHCASQVHYSQHTLGYLYNLHQQKHYIVLIITTFTTKMSPTTHANMDYRVYITRAMGNIKGDDLF